MPKNTNDIRTETDREFPLHILYSSPPEVSSLNEWVHEIENQQQRKIASGSGADAHSE